MKLEIVSIIVKSYIQGIITTVAEPFPTRVKMTKESDLHTRLIILLFLDFNFLN